MTQCIIQINDEVNCKLVGLDLSTRKTLVEKFKYEIPGARYQPSVRLGRWDGKVPFFNLGGTTYINLLPNILPLLENKNYDVSVEDSRSYSLTFQFETVNQDSFSHVKWPVGHVMAGQGIMLRDYQVEIINRFLANPQCIQEIATGSGKCLSGDTVLKLDIDENTPFGKFILDKMRQEKDSDVTRDTK